MINVFCVDCGVRFRAKNRSARRCPKCKKIYKSEQQAEYRAQYKYKPFKRSDYTENNWRQWFSKPLKVKEKPLPWNNPDYPKQHYCSGYDSANIECIKCYENSVCQYKGCYKK